MAKVWKRKDRDVWVADYRDGYGQRRRPTATTRKDAEDLLAEKIKESRKSFLLEPKLQDITVQHYAEQWFRQMEKEIEPKTLRGYKQNLETHILPLIGHLKLRDLRVRDIKELLRQIRESGHGKNKTSKR